MQSQQQHCQLLLQHLFGHPDWLPPQHCGQVSWLLLLPLLLQQQPLG
jgi:hypothetical protein